MESSPPPPPPPPRVTFVTAFMNIYDRPLHDIRDIAWRFDHFAKLAKTGIPICVYVDTKSEDFMRQFIEVFDPGHRVRVMRVVDIHDTWIAQSFGGRSPRMPEHRTPAKDTFEYMALMNSKIEFLKDTVEANPWNTDYFAWVDFNIWHVFRDDAGSTNQLKHIASGNLSGSRLAIPGCWGPWGGAGDEAAVRAEILDKIHWRFCGGFFMGHRDAVMELWSLYETHWPQFLVKYEYSMVWEVNFWTWLEASYDWKPNWFLADHDDRMIQIPIEMSSTCLVRDYDAEVVTYPYKEIVGYYPMSASFTTMGTAWGGETRVLNTRYVNYWLTPQGAYVFSDPNRVIRTKNIFSILDANWRPVNFIDMVDPAGLVSKPIPECPFDGIEDIRIFPAATGEAGGAQLHFIGTSINYSNTQSNRMIYGKYDIGGAKLCEARVLDSPENSYCEKNWAPIVRGGTATEYVYKWSPFQVRTFADGAVRCEYHIESSPMFKRLRGSSAFVPSVGHPGRLIGVAHFSVNDWPRDYYHALVLLDQVTLRPVAMTPVFTFCKERAIEFCIGFSESVDRRYHFWISQFDRDARMVTVDASKFSWTEIL